LAPGNRSRRDRHEVDRSRAPAFRVAELALGPLGDAYIQTTP
jgi:hypothetical protein